MTDQYHTLTRRPFEELVFKIDMPDGQTLEISQVISNIQGNQARISVKTPPNVRIARNLISEANTVEFEKSQA